MAKQRSVQLQARDRGAEILQVARSVTDHPERFEWLRALLAAHGCDLRAGILVELRSVPDQGCWVHYGMWLANAGTFLKFVADEKFRAQSFEGSGLLEYSEVEDVTAQVSTVERISGVGKSFGWLALNAMRQLNAR